MYYKQIKDVFFSHYQCIYSIFILRKSLQYACILHLFSAPDHFTVLMSKEDSPLNSHICNNLHNLITMSLIRKKREKIYFFVRPFRSRFWKCSQRGCLHIQQKVFPSTFMNLKLWEACGYTTAPAV